MKAACLIAFLLVWLEVTWCAPAKVSDGLTTILGDMYVYYTNLILCHTNLILRQFTFLLAKLVLNWFCSNT